MVSDIHRSLPTRLFLSLPRNLLPREGPWAWGALACFVGLGCADAASSMVGFGLHLRGLIGMERLGCGVCWLLAHLIQRWLACVPLLKRHLSQGVQPVHFSVPFWFRVRSKWRTSGWLHLGPMIIPTLFTASLFKQHHTYNMWKCPFLVPLWGTGEAVVGLERLFTSHVNAFKQISSAQNSPGHSESETWELGAWGGCPQWATVQGKPGCGRNSRAQVSS